MQGTGYNILYIDSEKPISRIVIYSLMGKVIKEIDQVEISAINVSDLKSGVYIIVFFNKNEYPISKKLIKEYFLVYCLILLWAHQTHIF